MVAPIDLDDGTWTVDALKAILENHTLFTQHGMEMPAKISEGDLKRAARHFDQHDTATTIADGKASQPLAYHDRYYTINPDLRPMAAAAGLRNTHGKNFSNGGLATWLQQWDVDHAPRLAMLLPREKKSIRPTLPKKAVQNPKKTAAESAIAKKRKAVATKSSVPPKRQTRTKPTSPDDDVETDDEDDGYLPQPTTEGDTPPRTKRQKLTRSHKPRTGQSTPTQTPLEANKSKGQLALVNAAGHLDDHLTDDTVGNIGDGDDGEVESRGGELQESSWGRRGARTKVTGSGNAKKKKAMAVKAKVAKRIADEHQGNALRPGRYSDPVLADRHRVNQNTILAPMEAHIRPGVHPAPTNQLGTRRLYERSVNQAKEEGIDLDLWMGGPSP